MEFDVIVVGGGPSGMMSAGTAGKEGARVLLLEKNDILGKKLIITGNYRCNITNNRGNIDEFIKNYSNDKGKFLYGAFNVFFRNELLELLNYYGVKTVVERGGRVFPKSGDSKEVLKALTKYMNENNVQIKFNSKVIDVILDSEKKRVKGVMVLNDRKKEEIFASRIILATGGMSYPWTGSSGDGYRIARRIGHRIVDLKPGLIPLETVEDFVKDLEGLSLENILITVYADSKKVCSELGDMVFTDFGVSGPVILKLSGKIVELLDSGLKITLSINLKPALDRKKIDLRLQREFSKNGIKIIKNVLKNLLPERLIKIFIQIAEIPLEKKCSQITSSERNRIIDLLTGFTLVVKKPRPIEEAIVTKGGVSLEEINPRTMESIFIKGLFFCGEIIDIDGLTGGYNLQSAFSTGYLAGKNAGKMF